MPETLTLKVRGWTRIPDSDDGEFVRMARPDIMLIGVGRWYDVKPREQWKSANVVKVIGLRGDVAVCQLYRENRRSQFNNRTDLGQGEVPYTAFERKF